MRTRDIKPGFFHNEELAALPPAARLLYIGLWQIADRRGRLKDRPKLINAEVFPYDEKVNVDRLLKQLTDAGFIRRYTADGVKCIWIPTFLKNQNPHPRETESVLPPHPDDDGEGVASTPAEAGPQGAPDEACTEGEGVPRASLGVDPDPALPSYTSFPSLPSLPSSTLAAAPAGLPPPRREAAAMKTAWENKVGFIPPSFVREFEEMARAVPEDWFLEAIDITLAKAKSPNWKFCRTILQGALAEQKPPGQRKERPEISGDSARSQFLARYTAAGGRL